MKNILLSFVIYLAFNDLVAQNFDWAAQIGDSDSQVANSITTDSEGNVYTTGWFRGTVDFDPGPGIYNFICNPDDGDDPMPNDAFISKLDENGNFLWAKTLTGIGMQAGESISVDNAGNIYITGHFSNTVDFDPGAGIYNLTSSYYAALSDYEWDFFLLKLNSDGEFEWAFKVGNPTTGGNVAEDIAIDNDGNVYVSGRFGASTDFDPGPGVATLTWSGIWDVFVAKYDSNGNYVWANKLGGTGHELSYSLDLDNDNNVITTGYFYGEGDYDPGPGTAMLNDIGSGFDVFISKLTQNGDFVWVKHIVTSDVSVFSSATDNDNNVFLFANYEDTIDADPSVEIAEFIAAGERDIIIAKYNSDGDYLWAKTFGAAGGDFINSGFIDAFDNIYITGYFEQTIDFNPGPGIFNLTADAIDAFIVKYDNNGNFIWAGKMGGAQDDIGMSVFVEDNGNMLLTGYFDDLADVNPTEGYFYLDCVYNDIYITKLVQDYCSELTVIVDSLTTVGCDGDFATMSVHATGGVAPYTYEWDVIPPVYDSAITFLTGGFKTVTVTDSIGCNKTSKFLIDAPTTDGYDIAVNMVMGDLINNFGHTFYLDVQNFGCVPTDGFVVVVLDPAFEYQGASPEPDLIEGDSLIWNYTGLYFLNEHFTAEIYVEPHADLGSTLCTYVDGNPIILDAFPGNNSKKYCSTVVGSYDPNEKHVYPIGLCEPHFVQKDEPLTYTIMFQNTGTSEAVNIYIIDTISASLDVNTLKVLASSHDVITELLPGNIIKFQFNNIYLPDSNANEPESHGHVIFEISAIEDIADATTVVNGSAIYFDFNEPVITNTVFNTLVDELPLLNFEQTLNLCEGDAVLVGANLYNAVGSYIDTLNSFYGCDSIVTTTISQIFSIDTTNQTVELCEGEELYVGDNVYATSGIYQDYLLNAHGCDSIVYTTLYVHPLGLNIIDATICENDYYILGGSTYSEAGTYWYTATTNYGCDSVIQLNLSVTNVESSIYLDGENLVAGLSGATYQWVNCITNEIIVGETQQSFTPSQTGVYAVIISDAGCVDTSACLFIDVVDVTNIEELKSSFSFNNPAHDQLIITLNNPTNELVLNIYNTLGELIYHNAAIDDNKILINIQQWEAGLYYITLLDDVLVSSQKVVID